MIYRILITFCLIYCLQQGYSTITVKLDNNFNLVFPNEPNALDTLGQRIYDYSDETGYYACIIQAGSVPADKMADLDVDKFLQSMYDRLQDPTHQCQSIKQSPFTIGAIRGIEFLSRCKEDPDFPDIRYKRLFLYKSNLYVIDYWTYKSQASVAEQHKNTFFGSIQELQPDRTAFIPSALPQSKSHQVAIDWSSYTWILGLVAGIGVVFLFLRNKPKK